ncbi:hypothetical protein [Bdellovibrio sp. HCB2-146]|uniref:hypothetical protein n=1 Tax=Bdellovibrio sp. HCB2-146 TaxID=3394362 RepID=UPI0039BD28A3
MLESLEPFYKKTQITIISDRPLLFRVMGHHIYMGEALLDAPGHLEKALAKVWYRERNDNSFEQQDLTEEVITDLLVSLEGGDVDIGDPQTHVMTALRKVKWPYVIKSIRGYCESPWKRSEHYGICQNATEGDKEFQSEVVQMSLRPMLTASLVNSYRALSSADRYAFAGQLAQFLRQENLLPGKTETPARNVLEQAAGIIRNVNLFVSNPLALKTSRVHRLFVTNFSNELRKNGYSDAFVEASFDLLFVAHEKVNENGAAFKELLAKSQKNPQMQIALRDKENLWMLPSKYPMAIASFGQIKANKTIIEKCGGYSFSFVMDYADVTEKLLVVDRCASQKKEVRYSEYLENGAEAFAQVNKGVAFVQFHIPSLLMKKQELETVSNVFDFIQKRDVDNPSFKGLGWQEVRWDEKASAYQPKAYVDAIEWFRAPSSTSL